MTPYRRLLRFLRGRVPIYHDDSHVGAFCLGWQFLRLERIVVIANGATSTFWGFRVGAVSLYTRRSSFPSIRNYDLVDRASLKRRGAAELVIDEPEPEVRVTKLL